MAKASDNVFPKVILSEGAAPATPSAGQVKIYAKADGLMYSKDDAGTETLMSSGATGSVATDAIWDAAGDLAVGSGANTAARLAIGNAGGALSRVNGAVAWNSGTAFPTAAAGDRYWRTDRGLEYYYDGTRWLTTQLFTDHIGGNGNAFMPLSAAAVYRTVLFGSTYDAWLVDLRSAMYVETTNNGSNYWTLTLEKEDGTDIVTVNTSANSASTWVYATTAIGALLGTTVKQVQVAYGKTGAPGLLYAGAPLLTYRLVG